ncbi:MAG: sulfite exporter TauE/SafE family protein [Candidatus Manganitrophus sp.]|nr:sulfite exporter TauE/SafE family protein [Candidatus Manganitrophus sp.]MDC4226171.1 sulfite exporter TauE/SafE family protein [Candidatus Manganitrophus sp.]WDT72590.1 MAG: sulfite exporter TauE/SafE family protein [Candidatus Manganitrophus sp.]WDT79953.1 MAG: sulfite exporter TauE/SafE family protein [Candidatus Manganitrophus sp.]
MTEALLLGAIGAVAGMMAGLLGIGGGVLLVPALIFIFQARGVAPEIVTQLAVGTSLATILFTGSAGAWTHHKNGNVDWQAVTGMSLFIVVGTQVGAVLAGAIHGVTLKRLFGFFELMIAARMLIVAAPKPSGKPVSTGWIYPLGGLTIGAVSSLFGIGGGTLTVPLLVTLLDRPIKIAIGTSSAQGVVIALFGTAGFVYQGWAHSALPADAWGFVSPKAVLLIAVTSTLTAPVGASLANRLHPPYLSRAFGIFLIFVGMKLLGLF